MRYFVRLYSSQNPLCSPSDKNNSCRRRVRLEKNDSNSAEVKKIVEDIKALLLVLDARKNKLNELTNHYSSQGSRIDSSYKIEDMDYQSLPNGKDLAEHEYDMANLTYAGIDDLEPNFELAASLFLSSAERGFIESQNRIAKMYEIGDGVIQDKTKAYDWFTKAAEQGHPCAQVNLGLIYEYGDGDGGGVDININKGIKKGMINLL